MGKVSIRFSAPACTRAANSTEVPAKDAPPETTLDPVHVEWHEAISELPSVELDVLLKNDRELIHDLLLGQDAKVTVASAVESTLGGLKPANRDFCGIVVAIEEHPGSELGHTRFTLRLQNWFWLLTQSSRCRVFQGATVLDIVETYINELPVSIIRSFDHKKRINANPYVKRPYCVQYNETDFAFLSRLLEEEGIHYFLDADGRTIVFADDSTTAPIPIDGWPQEVQLDVVEGGQRTQPRLWNWRHQRTLTPSQFASRDFTFLTADKAYYSDAPVESAKVVKTITASVEHYPSGVAKWFEPTEASPRTIVEQPLRDQKDRIAKIRAEEIAVRGVHIEAAGNFARTAPGFRLKVSSNDKKSAAGEFLVLRRHLSCTVAPSFATEAPPSVFETKLSFLPIALKFRPQRRTPRPVISGTQSAFVAGVAADPIHTDVYGRIRVRFPWSIVGAKAETFNKVIVPKDGASCWLRVAQPWAGDRHGIQALPRVGNEVIVGFENGDPDSPVALGCVYNNKNSPPYDLPQHRTLVALKSQTPDVASDYSGLEIEDAPGKEQMHIHGRRHTLVDSSGTITTAAATTHNVHVGETETHLVGAGIGTSLLSLLGVAIAPSYRPVEGRTGRWRLDLSAPILKPWAFSWGDPPANGAPVLSQEINATGMAKRLDMTIGRRSEFAASLSMKTNHFMTINAPVFGGITSENAFPKMFAPDSGLREALRFLNWSSSIHYTQGRYFAAHDRPFTVMYRGGRQTAVGGWPGNLGGESIRRLWVILELLTALDHILPAMLPEEAMKAHSYTNMAASKALSLAANLEFLVARASRLKAGAEVIAEGYAGDKPIIKALSLKEWARAFSGVKMPGAGKFGQDSYEHVKGHSISEIGKSHAIVANGQICLKSREAGVTIGAKSDISITNGDCELSASGDTIQLGCVKNGFLHLGINPTTAAIGVMNELGLDRNSPYVLVRRGASESIELRAGNTVLHISDKGLLVQADKFQVEVQGCKFDIGSKGFTFAGKAFTNKCAKIDENAAQINVQPQV